MATLREQRREKRVHEILETALEVLGERGPSASMDQIAERALLTRVALYKYFPDKPALVRAIREWKFAQLAVRVREALAGTTDFAGQVHTIAREIMAFQDENPAVFRVLLTNHEPQSGEAFERFAGVVVEVMARAVEEGRAISRAPDELAGLLITMSFEPAFKRYVVFGEDHFIPPHLPELVAEVFLGGVMRVKGRGRG
ncbi:MAG: TetR/AcrR family transcriptional regulator [Meiothermus sp.]|nr:TetR/AcrR family transcriptional regulator [Meiothermus sp.]